MFKVPEKPELSSVARRTPVLDGFCTALRHIQAGEEAEGSA